MGSISKGSALATLAAALLLGACASSDVGDILGGPSGRAPNQIKGIVRAVDTSVGAGGDCRIDLDNATSASYLDNGGYDNRGGYGGGRASVYCDRNTRVVYQGQTFSPESLEPGDEVIAAVSDVGGRLLADRIDVTYDVSRNDRPPSGGTPYPGTPYPNDDRYDDYGRVGDEDLRGTVQRVDSRNRLLTLVRVQYYDRSLDRGSRSDDLVTLYYDEDTRVSFRSESYRPENLEPGDIVAVDVDQVRGTLVADDIRVLADARGNAASYPR